MTVGNPVLKELINMGKVVFDSSLQQKVDQLVAQTTSQLLHITIQSSCYESCAIESHGSHLRLSCSQGCQKSI